MILQPLVVPVLLVMKLITMVDVIFVLLADILHQPAQLVLIVLEANGRLQVQLPVQVK